MLAHFNLDDPKIIDSFDKSQMLKTVTDFPAQCQEAIKLARSWKISPCTVNNIVFLGMGGTGIAGDLIKGWLEPELKIPFFVYKDYSLPEFVNNHTLVITASYSGNTQEVISGFKSAYERKANILAISSGGELKKLASIYKTPHLKLPSGYQPRAALGFLFFPLLEALVRLKLVSDKSKQIDNMLEVLSSLQKCWKQEISLKQNLAKKLARQLYQKIPIIYGWSRYQSAIATRWKNQFNENSKSLAFCGELPEITHNEIVGWSKVIPHHKDFIILLFKESGEDFIERYITAIQKVLSGNFAVETISAWGKTDLAKIFSLTYLGDLASVYLAFLNEVDPTPIKAIDEIKGIIRESSA